jgi:hypothetical protein
MVLPMLPKLLGMQADVRVGQAAGAALDANPATALSGLFVLPELLTHALVP